MKKFFSLLIAITFFSCGSDDSSEGAAGSDVTFDRGSLLATWANDFVIPELEIASTKNTELVTKKDAFINEPTTTNLEILRVAYLAAYKAFQSVEKYEIGKAVEVNYVLNLNAYPTDKAKVETNITNQATVNLSSVLNQNAQGFPAVDYLINGLGATDAEIVTFYTSAEKVNYQAYLSKVINRINELTNTVTFDWKTSYKNTFISNTSSSVNGSVNQFLNAYIQYFEKRLRAAKIGVPLGQFTSNSFPEHIESIYKPEESKALLIEAFNATREFYLGKNNNSSISGVLKTLNKTELDAMIRLRFTEAETAIEALDSNLRIEAEKKIKTKMQIARDALQKIAILFKVDLASALNISIVFQDNDGD